MQKLTLTRAHRDRKTLLDQRLLNSWSCYSVSFLCLNCLAIWNCLIVVINVYRWIKQLEVAYSPNRSFCLRDFHRAVQNLPADAFIPEINDSETLCCRGTSHCNYSLLAFLLNIYWIGFGCYLIDVKLSAVISDRVLYSWGGEDVMRKVIVLSATTHYDFDSHLERTLMVGHWFS